jgi:hypothetical protein
MIVHRGVRLGDAVEVGLEIKHAAWIDPSFQNVRQQLGDVSSTLEDVAHVRADVLDDADELVADRTGLERRRAAVVPKVRPAYGSSRKRR